MKKERLVGAAMIAVSAVVGYWGYEKTQSLTVKVGKALGASLPVEVLLAYGGSMLLMLAGLWLVIKS